MNKMNFSATIIKLNSWVILKIPQVESTNLPSRGMVMVKGFLNQVPFQGPLEPDGKGSHFFLIEDSLSSEIGCSIGDIVSVTIEPVDIWTEPEVPTDILSAIDTNHLTGEWNGLTTKARWAWIRWIRSTKNIHTRNKRIEVACSKLTDGKKTPCCFNQSQCTLVEVSKSGILLDES